MTTPALGAVRAAFPLAEIVVVANPVVAELFSPHPDCDGVLVYDKKGRHKGIGGLIRFSMELRKYGFDLAVLFQNALEAALMARLAGIPVRVGYRRDCRGLLLTHGVRAGQNERRLHHTRYYLHLLDSVGIRGGTGELRLHCTEEESAWASGMLPNGSWAAVNPGAAYGSAKRWLPDRFAVVADRLHAEFGFSLLLTGGPAEAEIGKEIEANMKAPRLNLIGRTSVRRMTAVLSRCSLMVTNDSGPMHVAAALGVPIVALFGSTDHTTTSPLSRTCRIVRHDTVECAPCLKRSCTGDHRCMELITVNDVMAAVRELAPFT